MEKNSEHIEKRQLLTCQTRRKKYFTIYKSRTCCEGFYTNHMKAIKNKAISKQKKIKKNKIKRSKNWFTRTMREEMRLRPVCSLHASVGPTWLSWTRENKRQRVVNGLTRENDEKRKKRKIVSCYKSKLFETRQKYHKVWD